MPPEYTEREKACLRELMQVEEILADALGYHQDPEYGWAIGDRTAVTLAMEVRNRGVMPGSH